MQCCFNVFQLILYNLPKQLGQILPQSSPCVLHTWFPQVPHSKKSFEKSKSPPFLQLNFSIKIVCKIKKN